MNKRRLFAIDLDGTLLRSDYQIGPFAKSILKAVSDDGDIVLLSSGRPIRTLYPYYKELGFKGPICCYGGSYIGHPENPLCYPVYDPSIDKEDIISVVSPYLDELDFYMGENHHCLCESKQNPFLDKYFPQEGIHFRLISSLKELPEKLKIFVFSAKEEIGNKIEEALKAYPRYRLHYWRNEPYYEIILQEASKGEALEQVAAYYGIKKEDTFAFGDSENDYDMLEKAGHPYAMKGCKSVRLATTFPATEKGNDQEGVALEILKNCD